MADGKVTVELSVQDAQALAAWQRGRAGIGQMGAELKTVNKTVKENQGAGEQLATKLVAGFARMATGALSLAKAISFAKAEYDAMIAREKAAAGFQLSAAGAQRAALRNLSGSELTPRQLDQKLKAVQAETGADLTALYQSAADVLSARGVMDEATAVAQIGSVAKMDASMAPDEMSKIAGAALDIRKAFGGGAEQAIGAMLTAQQTARVTSTQDFAMNAVPALFALSTRGDTFRESSALYSTISQQSADVTGRRSGTAMIRFAQQVVQATQSIDDLKKASVTARMEFLVGGSAEGEAVRRKLVGNLNREFDASSQLAEQEADPTQKAALSAEAKQFFALIELLERGSPTRKAYQAALAATPEYEDAGQRFEQNIAAQRQLGLQKTARIAEIGRGALQTAQQDELAANTGQVRKDLEELLEQVGAFGRPGGHFVGLETGAASKFSAQAVLARQGLAPPETALRAAADVAEARLKAAEASGEASMPENAQKKAALANYVARIRAEADKEANTRLKAVAEEYLARGRAPAMDVRGIGARLRADEAKRKTREEAAEAINPLAGQSTIRAPAARNPTAAADRALADALRPAERQRKLDADALLTKQDQIVDLLKAVAENTAPRGGARPTRAATSQPPTIGGN